MSTIVQKLPTVTRIAMALAFTVFGANQLLNFLPQPPLSGPPAEFFGALFATGYMLPLIALTQIVAGVMLLSGRFVPIALTLLAPVLVNILAFHVFLAQGGYALPALLLAAELYLAWTYRDAFAPMLQARVLPHGHGAVATGPVATRTSASSAE
jgi:putative oxidoreductase